jgi:hypothetical protein
MGKVTIRKLDYQGRLIISYPGEVLRRDERSIVLRTRWDRKPMDLGFVVLETDDRWEERFFSDRWYNIFEIRASDGRLKGWYCNITRPAEIGADVVAAEDLALDLWVDATGEMEVLDEQDFAALPLTAEERTRARTALAKLQEQVRQGEPPFDGIGRGGR